MFTIVVYKIIHEFKGETVIFSPRADPPIPPENLMITESINNTDSSTVTIQWESLETSEGAGVDNYTVSVAPGPLSGDPSLTVMDTMIELVLNYNVQYTVSVVATNCEGTSDPSTSFEFTLG